MVVESLTPLVEPPSQKPIGRSSPVDYSCAGEALVVANLLPTTGPRFLVDVDAGDGVTWSLSRGLLDDGWSALLIEGNSRQFEMLTQNLSTTSTARCLQAICGNSKTRGDVRRLGDILLQYCIPSDFQLLVLNCAESSADVLGSFDSRQHRPGIIVMKDLQGEVENRSNRYSLLADCGYSYAGVAGAYSMWTIVPLKNRSYPPQALATLPSRTEAVSMVAFDAVPSAVASCGAARENTFLFAGWAFVQSPCAVPPLLYLEVRDHRTGSTDYFEAHRCYRPDVSNHFGQSALAMSGFRGLVSLKDRMAGSLSVGVIQMDSEHSYPSTTEIVIERALEDYEINPRIGLARKFLFGSGIEIGALQKPLLLPNSCKVRYVDRMALADLLHHYPELRGLPIQSPDIIDNGEQLSTISDGSQDFVIANHFLEHCQNPLQTLATFLRVLRIGGVLFMAVPDKRFTFDFDRPCTQYDVLYNTYRSGRRADRDELFHEWVTCVEHSDGQDVDARVSHLIATDYSIHYNVWTVDDLLTHLLRTRSELQFSFRLLTVVCSDNEAILLIEKIGNKE